MKKWISILFQTTYQVNIPKCNFSTPRILRFDVNKMNSLPNLYKRCAYLLD